MGWGTSDTSHSWASQESNPGSWSYRVTAPQTNFKFRPPSGPFAEWGKIPKKGELRMCMPRRKMVYQEQPGDIITFWP